MNWKVRVLICLVAASVAWLALPAPSRAAGGTVSSVPSVDLTRYAGKWYEVAKFPNRFQRACAADTTATYTLRADGKIEVRNECREANGKMRSATGTARLARKEGPASQLKVTFFWPFSGDYWILALDPDYRWALVGEPSRKYLWILSRTPEMDAGEYQSIVAKAAAQGFDVARLEKTKLSR